MANLKELLSGVAEKLEISWQNIVAIDCDVVLTPSLMAPPPQGSADMNLCHRLFQAAGDELAFKCKIMGKLREKEARVTSSYRLSTCTYVCHMDSFVEKNENDEIVPKEREYISQCYSNALKSLDDYPKCRNIVVCPPPNADFAEVVLNEIGLWLSERERIQSVILTCGSDHKLIKKYFELLDDLPHKSQGKNLESFYNEEQVDEELLNAVTCIQSNWRGWAERNPLLNVWAEHVEVSVVDIHRKKLQHDKARLNWERARLKMKLRLEMKRRREQKAKDLHEKMAKEREAESASVIQSLWKAHKRTNDIKQSELQAKKERAKTKLKLQLKMKKIQNQKRRLLMDHMKSTAEQKAAVTVQQLWRCRVAKQEFDRLKKETNLTRDELIAKWEHAAKRLELQKRMQQSRAHKTEVLLNRLSDAALEAKEEQKKKRSMDDSALQPSDSATEPTEPMEPTESLSPSTSAVSVTSDGTEKKKKKKLKKSKSKSKLTKQKSTTKLKKSKSKGEGKKKKDKEKQGVHFD